MDQTAITYPYSTLNNMTGETIHNDWRTSATTCSMPIPITSRAATWCGWVASSTRSIPRGHRRRISNLTLHGKPVDAKKKYKVAGWAPVSEGATGIPIWEVVAEYLRDVKVIRNVKPNMPKIVGIGKNDPGIAL